MAKGDPSGVYVPGSITPGTDLDTIIRWLLEEHERIASAMEVGLSRETEFLNVAPVKPREGMIRGADGTNWNPGAGQGVYAYYAGAWNKLG